MRWKPPGARGTWGAGMNDTARTDPSGVRSPTGAHAVPTSRQSVRHVHGAAKHSRKELTWLSLGALGVVYGDIGTSPLYAMGECLTGDLKAKPHAVAPDPANVLGVVSLFFWALLLVVVIKYLIFVLRADNKGEGGILALAALVDKRRSGARPTKLAIPILLALFGA